MVLRTCGFSECSEPAERSIGSCMLCGKHLCRKHKEGSSHRCPSADSDADVYFDAYSAAKKKHLAALLAKIQVGALEAAATRARRGIPCRIPVFPSGVDHDFRLDIVSRQCGGQKCHLDVLFDDGVEWIARIRLEDSLLPPQPVQDHIFLSEVATLQFHQPASPENPVGTSYILLEKMKGKPLDWNRATPERRSRILEQLADLYLEMEKHPLPMTGSLVLADPPGLVGGFAQQPWFAAPEGPTGPFMSLKAAYESIVHQQMQAISNHEITSLPVDNYITFPWRLSVVPALASSSASSLGPFYLKHYDDKGDHILVDEEYNITGVIGWEFASAEAKELAFSSPCMIWPVGDFYAGSNRPAPEELEFSRILQGRGRDDLSQCVLDGRRWQRFTFSLGGGVPSVRTELESLFRGLQSCFANGEKDVASYEIWKESAMNTFIQNDKQLETLLADEN
ncbi:hypothetical protein LZ30DRAFT_97882 [Colletotrichum cereale]|nr:hypothetical protein LZ30DRAFT_97882 [Colletotrichum cereale]